MTIIRLMIIILYQHIFRDFNLQQYYIIDIDNNTILYKNNIYLTGNYRRREMF